MPIININGADIHYTDEGAGAETVVFSHGLLMNGGMFAAQVAALKSKYRCIAFDHRGQGKSAVTEGGYDMETLAEDAAGLIETLSLAPCHFVGLSMGGFVGMRLAARRPKLLRSLTLVETSAEPEEKSNVPRYRMLNFIARWFGLNIVAGQVMPIMFGKTFLNDPDRAAEKAKWRQSITSNDRIGITRAVKGVVERAGVTDEIKQIDMPVLIIVGEEDVATVPEKSERMHAAIDGSKLVRIERAGHSSTIEAPQEVNRALEQFLAGVETSDAESTESANPA
ncbi:alpha/beta fold hydrolase [Hoeflea poritis]|uniref:Alpha/beta hydrolase n=1 Tax=Hoeflea poritis TaxID=2993659 RepID=A0ABT4VTE5_9HYPH|nr:alpha/beta hydrolase [Hoeflea poritis]MDA4847983.1 alpha/beta hydrolase [Hoeflea poritis]